MSPEQIEKVSWLFEEALSLAPAELARFLERECPGDDAVLREVKRLLSVSEGVGEGFLEQPATSWLNPSQLRAGDRVSRYTIQNRLGSGGMSVVYRALDTVIGRDVALKLLMPLVDENEAGERLFSELRALGGLKLDGVVKVFDFGRFQGMPYIVMECLEGEDLAKAIAGGRCGDFEQKVAIARQIAQTLRDVHEAKIVHRDIKPANLFLEPNGRVKLMDFGMAREDRPPGAQISVLMGTPEFISPEQIKGEQATFQSDIYSYGILLFELFSGTKPFKGQTAALLNKALHEPLPLQTLVEAKVAEPVVRLIRKTTEKEPSSRIESFERILEVLERIDAPALPGRSGVRWRWVAAVLALCAAMTLYYRSESGAVPQRQEAAVSVNKPPITPNPEPAKTEIKTPEKPPSSAKQREPQVVDPPKASTARVVLPPLTTIDTPPPPIAPRDPAELPSELKGVLTVPAPSGPVKPPRDLSAEHLQELIALLNKYSDAWQRRDVPAIAQLQPSIDVSQLQKVFHNSSQVELQLTLVGSPSFQEGPPLIATFTCRRFTRTQYQGNRAPPAMNTTVLVEAELLKGEWKIRKMISDGR